MVSETAVRSTVRKPCGGPGRTSRRPPARDRVRPPRVWARSAGRGVSMRDQARAVVIGGGIVGCSVLYHLAKRGWSDVVLVEKTELTAGSTWHAAGLLPLFNMSYSVAQLHKYSIDLYQQLEEETGQAVSFHRTGNLRLATNRERMDEYRYYCGTASTIGVPFELIGPNEIGNLWPLCNPDGLVGALFHPDDGHVAPADVTQALAKGARDRGAEINRNTEVTGIERTRAGEWLVKTTRGDITCETVVTATGSWARQVGAMVGLDLPTIPVEHQYLVTDTIPELEERKAQGLPEMPVLRETDASYYMREERQGLILGPYETGAPAWAVDGVPEGFGRELLPPDLERLEPHIEAAIERVPAFGRAGIKDCVNGPIPHTPDGNPLIGPAYGLPNFWLAEGFAFGITTAGGAGWQLADWIADGEPSIDMLAVDPRRFGAYANRNYTRVKSEEVYSHFYVIHYPDEERPAARPAKTSPLPRQARGAGRRLGPALRLGTAQLVCAGGYGGARRLELPPHQLFRTRGRGMPGRARARRPHRHHRLLQVPGRGASGGGGARPGARQPAAQGRGPAQARPCAHPDRRRALRVHGDARGTRVLLPRELGRGRALRPRFPAAPRRGRRRHHREHHHRPRSPRAGGPAGARHSAGGDRRRPLQRGLPLAHGAAHLHRRGAHRRHAGQLRGRARLGAAPPDRVPEPHLRCAGGGGRSARARHVRHAGDGFAQDRKVLPHVGAGSHHRVLGLRGRAGPLRPRSTRASSSAATRSWPSARQGFRRTS